MSGWADLRAAIPEGDLGAGLREVRPAVPSAAGPRPAPALLHPACTRKVQHDLDRRRRAAAQADSYGWSTEAIGRPYAGRRSEEPVLPGFAAGRPLPPGSPTLTSADLYRFDRCCGVDVGRLLT